MKSLIKLIVIYQSVTLSSVALAEEYSIPRGSNIIGQIKEISAPWGYDLFRVGHKYSIGFHEMHEANPHVNPWHPNGKKIIIPTQYILPKHDKNINDIVINLPELRMYYFPKGSDVVYTYPIGIGKSAFPTPEAVNAKIITKRKNPTWTVPDSVKKEWEKKGQKIVDSVDAGPQNPLGDYAMNLSVHGYLIHGTNDPIGVGLRISHGCIRMYPEDVRSLFNMVSIGTTVHIKNDIYKVGYDNSGDLYLEAHKPLSEDKYDKPREIAELKSKLKDSYGGYNINWETVNYVIDNPTGIPVKIGNKSWLSSRN